AAVPGKDLAQYASVRSEHVDVPLALLLQEQCRPRRVGAQESDGAARELGSGRRRSGRLERLAKDLLLEGAQFLASLDHERVREEAPCARIGGERSRLPA